jgi:tRNA(Arg) A34 adenosine deaminase TadA
MSEPDHISFMTTACELSERNIKRNGGPFGCVILDKTTNEIMGKGYNMVTLLKDPTLHAEMVAISDACRNLNTIDLSNCILYTTCEPCPMCLSAIYWAHIETVYYGNTKEDAANIGFDDHFIYEEIAKPAEERKIKMTQIIPEIAKKAFVEWKEKPNKIPY